MLLVLFGREVGCVGEEGGVLTAGGCELYARSAGVGDGYGGGSGEADGGGVAEEFGAGLGVVGVGAELAEGGAGQHEEVVLGEDVVHVGAEGGVTLAEGGEFGGGDGFAPGQALGYGGFEDGEVWCVFWCDGG
jgi:hypothetical protein